VTLRQAHGRLSDEQVAATSVRRNLVLQHYGAPTPYIDVTHDIRVAAWFALNKLTTLPDGRLRSEIVQVPFRECAIFGFLVFGDLLPIIDTVELVQPNESLRPHRQGCALGGAPAIFIAMPQVGLLR
jgi:hypothetical protein